MKRALIVLLLLAVVAGGLFADLTWSGSAGSGLEVAILDGGDPTFHVFHHDYAPWRIQIEGKYANDAGTAGAAIGVRNVDGTISAQTGNAWVKFADKLVELRIGFGGPGGFGTPGAMDQSNGAADVKGLNAVFGSFGGFSAGLGIAPAEAKFDQTRFTLGAKYDVALIAVVANFSYDLAGNEGDGKADAAAGLNFKGLGDIGLSKLAVDLYAPNLTDLSWIGIGPSIGFTTTSNVTEAGKLSANLKSQIRLPMGDNEADFNFSVGADASLPVGPVTAKLAVGFENKAAALKKKDSGAIDYRAWDALQKDFGGADPMFTVQPAISFSLGGGSMEAGYSLQSLLGDSSQMQHAIYTLLTYSF